MKVIIRKLFRTISLLLVGSGISKNKFVYNLVEKTKKWLKEDYVLVDGCKLKLDDTDRHGFTIFGEEDKEERELLKKILKKDDIVIDVGANIGYHTVVMAKYVGENGLVYAFEPAPVNVQLLKDTMKLNNFQNVKIIDKAVSDTHGKGKFYYSNGISAHSLTDFGYNKGFVDMEIISLDEYFENKSNKIDFVKIDAEGYDFKVLNGMKKILENLDIKLLIEFFPVRLEKTGD